MSASLDLVVGRALDGRYQVTSRIARGGMATVYLATDSRLDREVAVKVMHPHLADDDQFVARFIREAKSTARMSHPNVVAVHDQGRDDHVVYLVMEYVPGSTLRDLLNERGALTAGEALSVLEPLLEALAAAHRAGVVHRDVKPENVLLTDDGRVKVADFGLARAASTSQSGTTTGMLMGTAAYLSPELVLRGVADARSDVYATGIMLFEMLTGRQPFSGEVPIQVAYQHVNDEVPRPSGIDAGIPAALDEIVAWSTAKDPDDRPLDARELVHEVRSLRSSMSEQDLDRVPLAAGTPPGVSGPDPGTPTDTQHATRIVGRRRLGLDGAAAPTRARAQDPADPSDWGYGPQGGRRRRGLWALVTLLLAATVLGGAGWFFTAGPGAYTITPAVQGTADDAGGTLGAAGLKVRLLDRFDEGVAEGQVLGTDPAAGQKVRKGATVDVFVSRGSEFTVVDELSGQSVDQAAAILQENDLALRPEPGSENSETVPQGQVLSQEPAAGERIRRGEQVAVVVSLGREPIAVPSVTGLAQDAAVAAVTGAGLRAVLAEEFSSDIAQGAVMSQQPGEGTLFRGDAVTLVISQGPPLVPVPDVVGQQVQRARAALEAQGFEVAVEEVLGGFFGTVRSQEPVVGTQVPTGSIVTLTIV